MEEEIQWVILKEGFGIQLFSNAATSHSCKKMFCENFGYVGNFDGSDGLTCIRVRINEDMLPLDTRSFLQYEKDDEAKFREY